MKLWIARDKDGYSQLFVEEPIKKNGYFEKMPNTKTFTISCLLFPEVTFENSPKEVEIKLVSEIVGITESPSKTFPRVNEFEVGASYRR